MIDMADSSWVLVSRKEHEKNEKEQKNEFSSNYCENDELIAKKLQIIEVCDKVIFIEKKHVPTISINDDLSNSEVDGDIDDKIMADVVGSWEDGGSWEKFDFSGMSVIPHDQWKLRQYLKKKHYNEQIDNGRKKMLWYLLSEKPQYQIYKKRFLNPKMFFEPVRYRSLSQKCIDRSHDKIATELFDSLDWYTVNIIDKMTKQGIITNADKITNIDGSSSIILHTILNYNYESESGELINDVVLKILKKTFIKYDHLFPSKCVSVTSWEQPGIKHLTRREMKSLATKEVSILRTVRNLGIRCPEVITLPQRLARHIVVMSFIGTNQVSAPKVKYIQLEKRYWLEVYKEVKQAMITMYQQAHLIHNDLLEHILWHDNHCYFIDFSHAIDINDTKARHILFKNCEKITKFFAKKKINGISNVEQLLSEIMEYGVP